MKIFILIPAFNEKGNLEKLIKSIERQLKELKIKFNIFFVLQGNDGSDKLLNLLKKEKKFIDYIHFPKSLGIGRAYKVGYEHVDKSAQLVLTMDADLNHDVCELPQFLKLMAKNDCDLIIGSRFTKGGKFDEKRVWKKIASFSTNKIVSTILGLSVSDISSGYRLIKIKVIDKIKGKLKQNGYPSYMEFIILAQKSGFKIKEVPIIYHPRVWGKSKIASWKTVFDYLKFLTDLFVNS